MICLGILAALLVNVALPVTSWRTMFLLAVAPAALLFLGTCVCQSIPLSSFLKTSSNQWAEVITVW